jgi:exostosin family protein
VQVYLISAFPGIPGDPYHNFAVRWLRESAERDPFGQHRLVEQPDQADVILFVENHAHGDPYCLSVRHHPMYRRFPEKCFIYHDDDNAVAVLRGIYPSIRKRDYLVDRCRSAGYIARIARNDSIRYHPAPRTRRYLYSFFGEANSAVRSSLLTRAHPDGLIRDTTGIRLWQMEPGPKRDLFTVEYAEAILDSQFVLCPAGFGPATYRLFEAMEMGRAPVVLSDEWVPPQGPRWDEFSVRLPECRVGEISAILSSYSDRHEVMGHLARRAWEQWFAKPVCFHRLIELCADIQATPRCPYSTLRAWGTLLRSPHLRNYLQPYYRSTIRKLAWDRCKN